MRIGLFLFFVLPGCGGVVAYDTHDDSGAFVDSSTFDTASTPDTGAFPDTHVVDTGHPPVDASPPMSGATPPPRPKAAAAGTTRWFLVSKIYLGTVDRTTGTSSATAWAKLGYDLDGRTTTSEESKTSTNSCKRAPGSATKVLTDGELGRDDNFGQHFMAVLRSLLAGAETAINASITSGYTTMLLRLDDVGPDDNASVPGALYRTVTPGGGAAVKPTFTEADHVWIDAASVDGSKEALIKFPKGYMSKGIWVSGDLGAERVIAAFPAAGWPEVTIDMPRATMTLDVKTGTGVIAGAIAAPSLMKGFDAGLRKFGICPGNATYDQLTETAKQSQDLVLGAPSLQDTTVECSALSVGIGFDAKPSGSWGGIASAPPVSSGCP